MRTQRGQESTSGQEPAIKDAVASSAASDEKKDRLGVACVGGCGVSIAGWGIDTFDPDEHSHLSFLLANLDRAQLRELEGTNPERMAKWRASGRLTVLYLGEGKRYGAGGDPESGRAAAEESLAAINAFLEPLDAVIVVGGGGKGTGSGATPVVAKAAADLGKITYSIITIPFSWECGGRAKKAREARAKLLEIGPTITIYNDHLRNLPREESAEPGKARKKSLRTSFRRVNKVCLEPMLLGLQEIIQRVGDGMNIDLEDEKTTLAHGNYLLSGYAEAPEGKSLQDVATELVENPFQDPRIIEFAEGVLLWFHGEWDESDIEEIINTVTARMHRTAGDESLDFHIGAIESVSDDKRWISLIAVASEVPEVAAAEVVSEGNRAPVARRPVEPELSAEERTLVTLLCTVGDRSATLYVQKGYVDRWNNIVNQHPPDPSRLPELEMLRPKLRDRQNRVPDIPRAFQPQSAVREEAMAV